MCLCAGWEPGIRVFVQDESQEYVSLCRMGARNTCLAGWEPGVVQDGSQEYVSLCPSEANILLEALCLPGDFHTINSNKISMAAFRG